MEGTIAVALVAYGRRWPVSPVRTAITPASPKQREDWRITRSAADAPASLMHRVEGFSSESSALACIAEAARGLANHPQRCEGVSRE
jgi:hypothetical protein